MTGERREHPVTDSVRPNATGSYPMPEVRRTPQKNLLSASQESDIVRRIRSVSLRDSISILRTTFFI